jgi:hypothetical protein
MIILALLGFVVIGPERSQDVALRAGRFLRSLMKSPWWRDFNQVTQALRDLPTTLVRMADLEEAQAELTKTVREIGNEASVDVGSVVGTRNPWGIPNHENNPGEAGGPKSTSDAPTPTIEPPNA